MPRLRSAVETEAEGLRWAIKAVSGFSYSKVIFESDSKQMIDAMIGFENWPLLSPWKQDVLGIISKMVETRLVFTY